jgi:hypothetical protein
MLAAFFAEEEHVSAQGNHVQRMESRGVLLKMLKEFLCIYLVKVCGTIFKFVDVDFFDRGADEFLAAVFGCLPNTIVFSASLVGGFGFFQFYHRCIFGNFVIPCKPRRFEIGNATSLWSAL